MILSVKDQNKNLSEAAKQPKDTSHRSITAHKYAAQVSSSKGPSRNTVQESREKVNSARSSEPVRGSFEGLENSSSAHIIMNESGYSGKRHQIARQTSKMQNKMGGNFNFNSFTKETRASIIDNYSSSTMKDSSSDRLSKIVKNNMMFS